MKLTTKPNPTITIELDATEACDVAELLIAAAPFRIKPRALRTLFAHIYDGIEAALPAGTINADRYQYESYHDEFRADE